MPFLAIIILFMLIGFPLLQIVFLTMYCCGAWHGSIMEMLIPAMISLAVWITAIVVREIED